MKLRQNKLKLNKNKYQLSEVTVVCTALPLIQKTNIIVKKNTESRLHFIVFCINFGVAKFCSVCNKICMNRWKNKKYKTNV